MQPTVGTDRVDAAVAPDGTGDWRGAGPQVMEGFRDFAKGLRDEPMNRAYARDYLFD